MNFGLSQEISADLYDKAHVITSISDQIEVFFKDRTYGKGISSWTIGVICVDPKFEFFLKERKKYTKSKKALEYDIKIEPQVLKNAERTQIVEIIGDAIRTSLHIIAELKITDFDTESFRCDLEVCLANIKAS